MPNEPSNPVVGKLVAAINDGIWTRRGDALTGRDATPISPSPELLRANCHSPGYPRNVSTARSS